jgi:5'-nucleotidase
MLAPAAAEAASPAKRLRILVTNDDGFHSRGILALTRGLAQLGDVLAVAPATDQSGSSQSTHILKGETWATPHYRGNTLIGYEVEGTPADAVRFGIKVLGAGQPFDFVVSGINEGVNLGHINLYSGTVGAAMEALLHGIPALAVSQSKDQANFDLSARVVVKVIQQMVLRGPPKDVVLSINVPAGKIRGITTRPIGGLILRSEGFRREAIDGKREKYSSRLGFEPSQPRGSDSEAFLRQFVTITPIRLDRTDHQTLRDLQNWDLSLPGTMAPAP